MGAEGTANSSPNKLMKYHQTVQGDEIRNFYTSKGQPETKRYIITVHFWFSKVVLGILHILNLIFKITFSVHPISMPVQLTTGHTQNITLVIIPRVRNV